MYQRQQFPSAVWAMFSVFTIWGNSSFSHILFIYFSMYCFDLVLVSISILILIYWPKLFYDFSFKRQDIERLDVAFNVPIFCSKKKSRKIYFWPKFRWKIAKNFKDFSNFYHFLFIWLFSSPFSYSFFDCFVLFCSDLALFCWI